MPGIFLWLELQSRTSDVDSSLSLRMTVKKKNALLTERGFAVLKSEFLWVWIPAVVFVISAVFFKSDFKATNYF